MKNPLLFLYFVAACFLGQTILSMEPVVSRASIKKRSSFTFTFVPNGSAREETHSDHTITLATGSLDFSEQLAAFNAKMNYQPKPVKRARTPDTNEAQSPKKIAPEITTTALLKKCNVFSRGGVTLIPMTDNVS